MHKKTAAIAYVPVIHSGYISFFEKHRQSDCFFVLGLDVIAEFPRLAKEIRQLAPEDATRCIRSLDILSRVEIADKTVFKGFAESFASIVMPKEDVMLDLWQRYFPKSEVILDPTFLRWDKHNTVSENPITPDHVVSSEDVARRFMLCAESEKEKSSDWWRQVGCIIVRDGVVLVSTHNHHLPTEYTPYLNGDPRNNFHKGVHNELGTSIHAEAAAIGRSAKEGISLEGADVYVTTFPCPPCAKLLSVSGIRRLFYQVGYGMLDGEDVLRQQGIEIIRVVK